MTLYALEGLAPTLSADGDFWVAPGAAVIGNVVLESGTSVWFGCVIRGDNEVILIGRGSNVQESTVMHTDVGYPITIGENCTIGHKAMLHGCTIGDNSLIGMGATVLNGAKIGKGCLIGAGALVTDVPDGPAKDGGILQGDVILSFEGTEVADTRGLVRMVGNADVGAAVRMVVFREGKTQTLKVTLGRREDAEKSDAGNGEPMEEAAPEKADLLGMSLSVLSEALREELKLAPDAEGLVVTAVDETSVAYEKGIRAGDLVAEAGQQAVATPADLEAQIGQAKDSGRKSLLLLVRRTGEPRFVALPLE